MVRIITDLVGLLFLPESTTLHSPMKGRRIVSRALEQLRDLWNFIKLYADSSPQPRQDVGQVVLTFLHSLQTLAPQIVILQAKMSLVQKYCLQWTTCVDDCLKMLLASKEILSPSLFDLISEMAMVSAMGIPEIVVIFNEQLGPLLENANATKLPVPDPLSAYQVKEG